LEIEAMNRQKQFVRDLAKLCDCYGLRLLAESLAALLNGAQISTTYGSSYKGKRGTFRLVKQTFRELMRLGQPAEAAMVAGAFTWADGTYAY
jgi:hypothetical protein